jgi:hypothetical protein
MGKLALIAITAWSGLRGAELTYQMLRDARYTAAAWLAKSLRPGDRVGTFGTPSTLPHLSSAVQTQSLQPSKLAWLRSADGPEFIISMPLREFETTHELEVPEALYQQLLAGRLGYRQAALLQTPSLLRERLPFVNPPVRIFIREDMWGSRLANR